MKAILKFSFTLSFLLFLFLGIFLGAGFLQKEDFLGSRVETIPAPVDRVWDYLIDIQDFPNRRIEINSIRIDAIREDGLPVRWSLITDQGGTLEFELGDMIPQKKFQTKLLDSSFKMTGVWTYELTPKGNNTELRLTEESKITSPVIRGAFLFSGREANIQREMESVLYHFLR